MFHFMTFVLFYIFVVAELILLSFADPHPRVCSAVSDRVRLTHSFWGHPVITSTRRGEGGRLKWTHVDGGGQDPCGCPHRKLKLESTDVILSSSHAKKLASFFYQN